MNVLSLFDGMSCGQIALERAGIKVGNYYASEIDHYAIKVTQANYPQTKQLGDVTGWKFWNIDWASIDLIIGGSPCQGFSFAGNQLAFNDPRSKLFFVYVDILNHIKRLNPSVKFLLENVKMKSSYLSVINAHLNAKPVFINSSLVSAQNRQRYYWANWTFSLPDNKELTLRNISRSCLPPPDFYKKIVGGEIRTRTGFTRASSALERMLRNLKLPHEKGNALLYGAYRGMSANGCTNIYDGDILRNLSPVECERLQTVPDHYTKAVSNTQRYKMLGNGWTVDVIAHILKSMV